MRVRVCVCVRGQVSKQLMALHIFCALPISYCGIMLFICLLMPIVYGVHIRREESRILLHSGNDSYPLHVRSFRCDTQLAGDQMMNFGGFCNADLT